MMDEEYEKMYHFEKGDWWFLGLRELILNIAEYIKCKYEDKYLDIIDIGCGTGLNLKSLEKFGNVIGLDSSKDAIRLSKSRGIDSLISADAEMLPFVTHPDITKQHRIIF